MTTNIKQAAERLRRIKTGYDRSGTYFSLMPKDVRESPQQDRWEWEFQRYLEDLDDVSDTYLAELDETPVDEEFAVKNALGEYSDGSPVGLCKHDSAGLSLAVFSDDGQFTLTLYHETGEWTFRGRGLRMFNPTRGQVRTACRLFGITLKEGI